jgi:metacaspase-1
VEGDGVRQALCFASNYPGTPYALGGCVQDALDWASLFGDQGYDVSIYLDSACRREVMLGAIAEALGQARWGDRVVITWSGHGTWLPTRVSENEPDGRTEAWCPDDMQTAGLITDDDLATVLGTARRGVGTLVLSDSCHSGTVNRFYDRPREAGDSDSKPRMRFLPPSTVAWITGSDQDRPVLERDTPVSDAETERNSPLARAYTASASLISAAADDEVAYDATFGGRPNGAFTRAAIDAYTPGVTLNAWHRAIRERLPSERYPQSPALVATPYRRWMAKAL